MSQQPPQPQTGQHSTAQPSTQQQYRPPTGQQQFQPQTSQQQFQPETGQQVQRGFEQTVSPQVSDTVYRLEQIETDAEWAKTQAARQGDTVTAEQLEDLIDLAHVQKRLLLRQSPQAQTIGQCVQQGIQQAAQQLQQSQVQGVHQVTQQAQQLAQTITQASMQVTQSGGTRQMGVSPQTGGQTQLSGQQPAQKY